MTEKMMMQTHIDVWLATIDDDDDFRLRMQEGDGDQIMELVDTIAGKYGITKAAACEAVAEGLERKEADLLEFADELGTAASWLKDKVIDLEAKYVAALQGERP